MQFYVNVSFTSFLMLFPLSGSHSINNKQVFWQFINPPKMHQTSGCMTQLTKWVLLIKYVPRGFGRNRISLHFGYSSYPKVCVHLLKTTATQPFFQYIHVNSGSSNAYDASSATERLNAGTNIVGTNDICRQWTSTYITHFAPQPTPMQC